MKQEKKKDKLEPRKANWNLHLPLAASIPDEAEELKKNLVSFTCAYPSTGMSWRKRSSGSCELSLNTNQVSQFIDQG